MRRALPIWSDYVCSPPGLGGRYANRYVPEPLRNIISAESAANDGLAYPFLSISIYLTLETSKKVAFGKWFLVGWLCKWTILQPCVPLINEL